MLLFLFSEKFFVKICLSIFGSKFDNCFSTELELELKLNICVSKFSLVVSNLLFDVLLSLIIYFSFSLPLFASPIFFDYFFLGTNSFFLYSLAFNILGSIFFLSLTSQEKNKSFLNPSLSKTLINNPFI